MQLRPTIKTLLWLIAAVVLFHLAILIKLIPYEVTWGGRLKNDSEMYVFESTSILANLLLGFALLVKGEYLLMPIPPRLVNVILWIFLALFGLNTVGNLFAETLFEKSLSLLTVLFTFLIWTVLKSVREQSPQSLQ